MPEILPVPIADRARLAKLVSERLPGDALPAYYALNHPARRVRLFAIQNGSNLVGFVVAAQTGQDLFRPLVIPVAANPEALAGLLEAALRGGRPALLHMPLEQRPWLPPSVDLQDERVVDLHRLDPKGFPMEINVLVIATSTPEGLPRFEIRSGGSVVAAAGLNWRGPFFAEVYVEGGPQARSRGLTRSVLAAATGKMISEQLVPLTFVPEADTAAQAEAAWVGYRRTGERFLVAEAMRTDGDRAQAGP
jgi:hypothetical protein